MAFRRWAKTFRCKLFSLTCLDFQTPSLIVRILPKNTFAALTLYLFALTRRKSNVKRLKLFRPFSSDNKSKVHIIATHWDVLNDPEIDWTEQKDYLVKRLTGKAFFDKQAQAAENIMHSAAFIYNLCRDYDSLGKKGALL